MIYSAAELENKINRAIEELDYNRNPLSLFNPIKYILSIGGKRMRPILTLMSTNLFSENIDVSIPAALGIEIFHNFSLLHDDLMDNASIRRNQPTVHVKWDSNTAVLSGDAMLIDSYKHIAKVSKTALPQVFDIFNATALQVCEGQQYDMDFEKRLNVNESEYLNMIQLKTAVLVAASLKIGAILGNASVEDAQNLYDFGINIGLAFQLKDDLLDIYGVQDDFGKKIGGDILSNKKTFLLIKALEKSSNQQKNELYQWIEKTEFDPQTKIKAVKEIYDDLNLESSTNELIKKYYIAALNKISKVNILEERKKELLNYTHDLMHREK